MSELFRRCSRRISLIVGSGWAILFAVLLIGGTGWYFDFSDRWEANASFLSTLSALILLFFLQASQNHSDNATHLKLDELVRAVEGARDEVVHAEERAEAEIDEVRAKEEEQEQLRKRNESDEKKPA